MLPFAHRQRSIETKTEIGMYHLGFHFFFPFANSPALTMHVTNRCVSRLAWSCKNIESRIGNISIKIPLLSISVHHIVHLFLFSFFFSPSRRSYLSTRRFIADYTTYPADYAEVSTFSKPPSECNSGSRSPAPYATTTLVGNSRLINYKNNNHNMYFTSDLYPAAVPAAATGANGNAIAANRYVYSESYYNPKEKINITENRLGNNTFNPGMSMPHTPFGTIRKNRFKLLRNPQFRISFGDNAKGNTTSRDDVTNAGDNASMPQQQHHLHHQIGDANMPADHGEQLYVKVGETHPPNSNEYNNWAAGHQHHHHHLHHHTMQLAKVHGQHQQQQQASSASYPHLQHANSSSQSSIYQNHHHRSNDSDKDMIYAPSGNRSVISYMSANSRFDDV